MGMFDDVICEAKLPDGFVSDNGYQTKDFECVLATFKITAEGRLVRREYEWSESDDAPLGIRREQRGWKDVNYHGFLNFYTSGLDGWHEYDAKFTDGQLVEIKLRKGADG